MGDTMNLPSLAWPTQGLELSARRASLPWILRPTILGGLVPKNLVLVSETDIELAVRDIVGEGA